MRTLILAILGVTLISGGSANVQAQMQSSTAMLQLPCYPAQFVDDAMSSEGMTAKIMGAFDDGDLLLIYRDEGGGFMAAFATPEGQVCTLGAGKGLETRKVKPVGQGS